MTRRAVSAKGNMSVDGNRNGVRGSKTVKALLTAAAVLLFLYLARYHIAIPLIRTGLFDRFLAKPSFPISKDVVLPGLTGAYRVGKTSVRMVDGSRKELVAPEGAPESNREWMVHFYYPARSDSLASIASYIRGTLNDELMKAYSKDSASGAFERFLGHVTDGAPPVRVPGGFPVLVFSVGGGEQPELYTGLFEQLASHGYVVASLSDTYSSPVAVFPDGRVVRSTKLSNAAHLALRALLGDHAAYAQLSESTRLTNTRDILHVVDELPGLNDNHPVLRGMLDVNSIAAFGHSIGGASAAKAALLDPRVDAVIVMDGYLFHVLSKADPGLKVPVLYLSSEGIENSGSARAKSESMEEEVKAYLDRCESPQYARIPGTTHLSFVTDLLLANPNYGKHRIADRDPEDVFKEITDLSLRFFDRNLKRY